MNEQELIAWAKDNNMCWNGLTAEEREFFERHGNDVGQYYGVGLECVNVGNCAVPPHPVYDDMVFRLRRDYEPEPVKPAMGWREYVVELDKIVNEYWVPEKGLLLSGIINNPGFGGTQYRMPDGNLTAFIGCLPNTHGDGPAIPVKVRFWEAKP